MDWLRLYTDILSDRKLRRLPASQRWLWITVLILGRQSAEPGRLLKWGDVPVTDQDLSEAAAIALGEAQRGMQAFIDSEMVHLEGRVYVITNWLRYQYESDNSTKRVQAYRQKQRRGNVSGNVSSNVPEAEAEADLDSDTETEAKRQHGNARNGLEEQGRAAPPVGVDPYAGIPFQQHGLLIQQGYTADEIADAKAEHDARGNTGTITRWDRYLPRIIDDRKRLAEHGAQNGSGPVGVATGRRETATDQAIREAIAAGKVLPGDGT